MARVTQPISAHWRFCKKLVRVLIGASALASYSVMALDVLPYPAAILDAMTQEDQTNHPLVSSPMKKVNGVVLADRIDRRDGSLQRWVYQLPPGHESEQGYEFYVQQLKKEGVESLFCLQQLWGVVTVTTGQTTSSGWPNCTA